MKTKLPLPEKYLLIQTHTQSIKYFSDLPEKYFIYTHINLLSKGYILASLVTLSSTFEVRFPDYLQSKALLSTGHIYMEIFGKVKMN